MGNAEYMGNSGRRRRQAGEESAEPNTKFFFGTDTGSISGSSAIDGGIIGLGLGALGAAVLGPTIQGVLGGGQQSAGFSACGRRKRQADNEPEERFFLPTGGSCTCNDINSGRRRRQAGEESAEPNTKFFGNLFGGAPHCGSCCYGSSNFGSSNNNFGSSNNFGSQSQCQCDYSKTFQDQY